MYELDCGGNYMRHKGSKLFQDLAGMYELACMGSKLFKDLAGMDELDCGKRYLCEAAATTPGQLNLQAQLSLALFQVWYR